MVKMIESLRPFNSLWPEIYGMQSSLYVDRLATSFH